MAVNIDVEKPEESKPSHLKRSEFNNLALLLSKHVPFAKSRAISKLNRTVKLLKKKDAKDGGQGGKNQSKAERLIEQIELLKKFRKLDIAKLLFLIRRSAKEVQKDKKSCIQEEALSCIADYEHINSTLQPHQERYPNLVEDAFKHLKIMGLKYRKDRISKMKYTGKVQKLMAQERLLLVTAHQLMGCERELALLNTSEDDLLKPSLLQLDQDSEQQPALDEVETLDNHTSDTPRKKHKRSHEDRSTEGKIKKKRSRVKVEEAIPQLLPMDNETPPVKEASTPRITSKQIGSTKVLRLFNLEALNEEAESHLSL